MSEALEGGSRLGGLKIGDWFTLSKPSVASKSGQITDKESIIWLKGSVIVYSVNRMTIFDKTNSGILALDYLNAAAYVFDKSTQVNPLS